jgi:hypothetical protein
MVTYADNSAIGFFSRMGFSEHPLMGHQPKYFKPFIMAYDHATLMSVTLDSDIDYLNLDYFARSVKEYVETIKPKTAEQIEKWPVEQIAGIPVEAGPPEIVEYDVMTFLLGSVCRHSSSIALRDPVPGDLAPAYLKIISNPMDLSTMKEKMKGRGYAMVDLLADLKLMFQNCYVFNGPDSPYSNDAKQLEDLVKEICELAEIPF